MGYESAEVAASSCSAIAVFFYFFNMDIRQLAESTSAIRR